MEGADAPGSIKIHFSSQKVISQDNRESEALFVFIFQPQSGTQWSVERSLAGGLVFMWRSEQADRMRNVSQSDRLLVTTYCTFTS